MSEHAVIVTFQYGQRDLDPLFALEDRLRAAIELSGCGEYDGHEIATDGSEGVLYMYGPDADRLFEVVDPILRATPFTSGASVEKRYGPPEADATPDENDVLERAEELTGRGMFAEAAELVGPLTWSDDVGVRTQSLLAFGTLQSLPNQHQDVLTSLGRLERSLDEFLGQSRSPQKTNGFRISSMRRVSVGMRMPQRRTRDSGNSARRFHARAAIAVVRGRRTLVTPPESPTVSTCLPRCSVLWGASRRAPGARRISGSSAERTKAKPFSRPFVRRERKHRRTSR